MLPFLSAQCISSIGQIIKSVCVSVSHSVSEWVCHTKRVKRSTDRNLPPIFTKLATKVGSQEILWNISILQTGSGINPHHCSYRKISLISNISKMVRDTMLDSKEVIIGNHQWAFDWRHYLWPWMTLNRLSSRSLQLQSNMSITVYGMQQRWAETRSIERVSCYLV